MMPGLMLRRRSLLHRVASGGGSGNGADDEFVYGSTIDTAGARYFGAYGWTVLNARGGSNAVSGGQLSLTCAATTANMDPILAVETIDAGEGAWETKCNLSGASAIYQGVGLAMREAGTGKIICFGYAFDAGSLRAQVRRLTSSYTGWASNYNGAIATDYSGYLRIIREPSGMLGYLTSEDGTTWTVEASAPQTNDFTTAPSHVGLWVNALTSAARTGTFDYFRKVSPSLPYDALFASPGAENGVAGWANVTGSIGTRAGVQRSGNAAFKISGNPGAFEVYTEWTPPTALLTAIDTGTVTVTCKLWGNPWTGATTSYHMRLNAYNGGGSSLTSANTGTWTPTGTYSQKTVTFTVPALTRKFRVTVEGTTTASDDGWWDDLTLTLS